MDPIDEVEPQDPTKKNSPKAERADVAAHTFGTGASCMWNDKEYSDGGSVCDAKIRYKCWNGKWVEVGQC